MSHPNLYQSSLLRAEAIAVRLPLKNPVFLVVALLFAVGLFGLPLATPHAFADELAPEAPGMIAGVVKNINGEPLANSQVMLYRRSLYSSDYWDNIRVVTTQADGKYRFTVLPVGNYRVGAFHPQTIYAPIFYPAAPILQKATDINVTGNQVAGIDLILQPGGQITGVVTSTVGITLTAGMVILHHEVQRQGISSWEVVQTVPLSAGGGIYTFTNLSANTYRICAQGWDTQFATYECYDDVYDINRATSLTLTSGTTISNVNIVLGDGADYGQISGRVTALNDEPLANIEVYAMRDADSPFVQSAGSETLLPTAPPMTPLQPMGGGQPYPYYSYYGYPYARTDSQGNYRLATLSEGNYRLMFRDPAGNYAFEYYNDSLEAESATVIPLMDKQSVSDINVQLAPGGHIRGMVTIAGQPAPIQSIYAERKTSFGWHFAMAGNLVSSDGEYDIGGLPAGTYRIWAAAYITDYYTGYFYQGYFGSDATDSFAEIPVAVGETRTANIALGGGPQFEGSLSGRITAGGSPLAGAKVLLYPQDSGCCTPPLGQPLVYTFADAAGRYTINGLTSSNFRLGAADPAGVYATTYYTAHILSSLANVLTIEDGKALTNVNIDLPLGGAISGRVTRPNGEPVPDLLVSVSILTNYDSTLILGQPISSEIRTDANGRYTVKGLHPGDYGLCFADTQRGYTKCYGMLWWSYYDLRSGRIKVTAGATTADIDLRWGPDLSTYLPIIAK